MKPCDCSDRHVRRRVVLTGGPGAGKTAILELIRLFFCEHVKTLPEAAGIVFGGRFPRGARPPLRQAAQRAIYHIQRELESVADAEDAAVVLCDRGTVDCAAYWTGASDLFSSVRTTQATRTIATTPCESSRSTKRRRSTSGLPRNGPTTLTGSSWSRRRTSFTRRQGRSHS